MTKNMIGATHSPLHPVVALGGGTTQPSLDSNVFTRSHHGVAEGLFRKAVVRIAMSFLYLFCFFSLSTHSEMR